MLCGPAGCLAELHDPTFSRIGRWANRGHGRASMLIAVLILVSAAAAVLAFAAFRWAFRRPWGRAPAAAAAGEIEEHTRVRRFVDDRLDAEVVTGLALTAALVVAGLAVAVRHAEGLSDVDSAAALWAHRHGGSLQHRLLEDVSTLATT